MYSGARMSSRPAPLVPILLSACLSCGCGATTLRVSGGPTLDTSSRVGFEVLGSIGLGMPLDYQLLTRHGHVDGLVLGMNFFANHGLAGFDRRFVDLQLLLMSPYGASGRRTCRGDWRM